MKYIEIPREDIVLVAITGEKVVDPQQNPMKTNFEQFVRGRLTDPIFAAGMETINSVVRITQALDKKKNGILALETQDWDLLVQATKTPTNPYDSRIGHCFLPFMKAITEAGENPPEEPSEESKVDSSSN